MTRSISENKKRLLLSAESLFMIRSVQEVSVRDIAKSAGLSVAMISYYFGSKDQMIRDLHIHRMVEMRKMFSEFAEFIKGGKPEMQMKELVRFIVENIFKYRYLYGERNYLYDPSLEVEWLEMSWHATKVFDEVVKKGVASGVFTFAPRAEDMVTTIFGSCLYAVQHPQVYQPFMSNLEGHMLFSAIEKKVYTSILLNSFAIVGFSMQ